MDSGGFHQIEEDGGIDNLSVELEGDVKVWTGGSACRTDMGDSCSGSDETADSQRRFPDKMAIADGKVPMTKLDEVSAPGIIPNLFHRPRLA